MNKDLQRCLSLLNKTNPFLNNSDIKQMSDYLEKVSNISEEDFLNQSVTLFIEAKELFYSRKFLYLKRRRNRLKWTKGCYNNDLSLRIELDRNICHYKHQLITLESKLTILDNKGDIIVVTKEIFIYKILIGIILTEMIKYNRSKYLEEKYEFYTQIYSKENDDLDNTLMEFKIMLARFPHNKIHKILRAIEEVKEDLCSPT